MKYFWVICLIVSISAQDYPKQSPIIGIYTQTTDQDDITHFQSYIGSSYVKFIQMSGAQVVPLFAFSTQAQIATILPKLNGVLFPGGDQPIDFTQRWTLNAKFILQWAMKQNDAGRVFPVWSVCLGFQLLAVITSGSTNIMTTLSPVRGQLNILNTMKFTSSDRGYILGDMLEKLILKLTTGQGIMFYDHNWAVLTDTYNQNKNLSTFWKIITQSTSPYNQKFISLWQSRKYPFYGVQFHPQVASYQWTVHADRSYETVQIEQIMANKFVDKARQSPNRFASYSQFKKYSIYNYQQSFTTIFPLTTIYRFNETRPESHYYAKIQNKKIEKNNIIQM